MFRPSWAIIALLPLMSGCAEERASEGHALKAALSAAEAKANDGRIDLTSLQGESGMKGLRQVLLRPFSRTAQAAAASADFSRDKKEPRSTQRYDVSFEVTLTPHSGPGIRVVDALETRIDGLGDFVLRHQVAWASAEGPGEEGRRCWRVGPAVYLARDYGQPTLVTLRALEDRRCLDGTTAALSEFILSMLPGLRLVEAVEGPGGVKVTLALAEAAAAAPAIPAFYRPSEGPRAVESEAWFGPRATLFATHGTLTRCQVELVFEVATGAWVSARVIAGLAYEKQGTRALLEVRGTLTTRPDEMPIEAPTEARIAAPRSRIFDTVKRALGEEPVVLGTTSPLPEPGDAPPLTLTPGAENAPSPPSESPP